MDNHTQDGFCNNAAAVLEQYKRVYMCVYLVVAVLGCGANIVNIAVFTRRCMMSPINVLLTALAACDLAFLVMVVPYTLVNIAWIDSLNTWWWSLFDIISTRAATILQVNSLLLSLTLAVWRYIAISRPLNSSRWCSLQNTVRAIVASLVVAVVGNIPYCLTRTVAPVEGGYDAVHSQLALAKGKLLIKIAFLFSMVLLRMLPLLLIVGFTIALVKELVVARRRRKKLVQSPNTAERSQNDRTTAMLLVVLGILLATIGPHSLLNFIGGVFADSFGTCRDYLGFFTYFMVVFNASVNMLVYYAMSQQFRKAFKDLFKKTYSTTMIPLQRLTTWTQRKMSNATESSNANSCSTQSTSHTPSDVSASPAAV